MKWLISHLLHPLSKHAPWKLHRDGGLAQAGFTDGSAHPTTATWEASSASGTSQRKNIPEVEVDKQ